MKHTIQTTTEVSARFSFEGGFEELFVSPTFSGLLTHVAMQQDGNLIEVPASDFRAFLKALSEWADEAGIPA
jgi:hypothetical protein